MVSAELWVAIVSLFTLCVSLTVAAIVLVAAPHRGVNRALAALVALKGINMPPGVVGALVDNRQFDYYAVLATSSLGIVTIGVYLLFVGLALETPLTRPLRLTKARIVIAYGMLFGLALPFLAPHDTIRGAGQHVSNLGWVWETGPIYSAFLFLYIANVLFTLAAAISAFRATKHGSIARRRAKAYLAAFATNDILVAFTVAVIILYPTQYNIVNVANIVINLAFSLMVATALLRAQLFDFDLRVKVGLKRGTVAAVFLGTFFIVTAVAEQYLQQYGYLFGGVAVGLLLFLLSPIQRAAETVADRMFPGVSDQTDYIMRKKVEVYREALREAMQRAGTMDPMRSVTIRKLRTTLGLTQRDHELLVAALAGSSPVHRGLVVAPGALILGKYRVERQLGEGGGGRAFLAQDVRMNRRVVLKTITGGDQASAIREARAAAAIEHPNVVRVYDVEDLGDETLLVMEYVDGGSLKDRLIAGVGLQEAAFARLAEDVLAGLAAVHGAGAVHRDVKPGNILLTRDGRAKLSDFGIARLPGFETTIGDSPPGTIQYMSPEQAHGERVTLQSDLYSAAASLFEARTGRPLVKARPGENPIQMRMRIGGGRPFDAKVEPMSLRAWFAKALSIEPSKRFRSAAEMSRALMEARGLRGRTVARASRV